MNSCPILMNFLQTKTCLNVVLHCDFSIILLSKDFKRVHILSTKQNSERQEDKTMKVLLKTYHLGLCLNCEYLKYMLSKNMIK